MTMWTGDSKEDEEEGGAAAGERFERVLAMRDGTRNENATRLWGAIEMDVNEDKVAPWKVDVDIDGMDSDSDFGCAEPEPEEGAGDGHGATLGMKDVTTATGCAVSRRSARIFWERPRTLILLAPGCAIKRGRTLCCCKCGCDCQTGVTGHHPARSSFNLPLP
jgi:hypothetical protein